MSVRFTRVGSIDGGGDNISSLWTLSTADSIATIIASGYFDNYASSLRVGDIIMAYVSASWYVYTLGVTSNDLGVVNVARKQDPDITSHPDIVAILDRIYSLEQNTGAPANQLPGVVGFAATGAILNEDGSVSLTLSRTAGTTGAMSFDIGITETNAGTNTYTFDGVAFVDNGTVTIPNGASSATIVITNSGSGVTVAGTIALVLTNADIGSISASPYNGITVYVVPTPAAQSTGVIIDDAFSSLAATQSAWAPSSNEGAVVTSFLNPNGTTATLDVSGGGLVLSLPAGGINNVRAEKNFGNYIGDAGVTEIWGRFKVTISGGDESISRYQKIAQINWEVAGGDREHQVQLQAYRNSSGVREYELEIIHFGVNGSASTSQPPPVGARISAYWSGMYPTYDKEEWIRFHIKNSSAPGVADGVVEFWRNDVPMFNVPLVALNDAGDPSTAQFPNRFILSGYMDSTQASTVACTKTYDDVLVQTTPVEASWAPTPPAASVTPLVALDTSIAAPYGWEYMNSTTRDTVSIITDPTLSNSQVMKIALGAAVLGSGDSSRPGPAMNYQHNNWAQGINNTGVGCIRILAKFGDSETEPFWRRNTANGSGLKMPSYGITAPSRFINNIKNTADPGGADLVGYSRILVADSSANLTSPATTEVQITPGIWYWIVYLLENPGAAATFKMYFTPYVDGNGDYAEGSPTFSYLSGFLWDPSQFLSNAGQIDSIYHEFDFLDASNNHVSRNLYIRYYDVGNDFLPSIAA